VQATGLTQPFRTGSTRFRALLRRLRRDPQAAAFDDIQATFAKAAAVRDVTESDIDAIAALWEVELDGPLRQRTVGLYRAFLRHCLDDHRLSAGEAVDLEHMRRLLHLSREDAELAHRQVAREAYARSVDEVLADATIDEEERTFLAALRDRLGLPDPIADNIEAMKRRQRGARDKVPPRRSRLN
jgi:hypothetical protein